MAGVILRIRLTKLSRCDGSMTLAPRTRKFRILKGTSSVPEDLESNLDTGQELQITHNVTQEKLPILTRRIPSGDTSSVQAFETLQDWIETCITHHGACAGHKISKIPKRILEIGSKHVYLREHLSISAMYACLSHCWGPSGPTVRLDKMSFSLLTGGIAIDQLPKTFADSIHLCARLGIRFIWIDACCKLLLLVITLLATKLVYLGIMQDDKDDWKEAAAAMANIYEQAHFTIAATWTRDSNSGLFAPDQERYRVKRLRDSGLYVRGVASDFPHDFAESKDFPLLTRAWVYQERLLSSRMIHFTRDQVSQVLTAYEDSCSIVTGTLARSLGSTCTREL